MARREDIMNTYWDEVDHLSDDAAMLYVWSWTNTKCGMAGIYKVPRRKIVEGRFSDERLDAALKELADDGRLFYVEGVLWCKARVGRLANVSEQIATSILNDLREVGRDHPLYERFVETYGTHPKLEPRLTLGRASVDPQPTLKTGDSRASDRGSTEGQPTPTGQGHGSSSSSDEFEDWLEHYKKITGNAAVRGSKPAKAAFAARRKDNFTLDQLKAATVGCHGDEFCRDNGFDVPETILRASKVQRYIRLADSPRPAATGGNEHPADRKIRELKEQAERLDDEEQAA